MAPPACTPRPVPKCLQPKAAAPAQGARGAVVAPGRPAAPQAVQAKMQGGPQASARRPAATPPAAGRRTPPSPPTPRAGGTPKVIQRTMQDVLAARNYWTEFVAEVNKVDQVLTPEIKLIGSYYFGVQGVKTPHPDPLVEEASKGLHHDAKEIASKAGGYLYQQRLQHNLRDTEGVSFVHSGTNNKTQPDIITHNVPLGHHGPDWPVAVEAKRTIGTSYTPALKEAIGQLAKRREFPEGKASIKIHNTDLQDYVRNNQQAVATEFEQLVGVQKRAFDKTKYAKLGLEIVDHNEQSIFKTSIDRT